MSMNKNYPLNDLGQRIESAQKILVLLPKNPQFDQVAAALSLMLSFEAAGKSVSAVCPSPMTVEFNHLVGVNKITDQAQGSDLVVSFNYSAQDIERVSYNDDGNRPNVVIQPKVGAPPLNEKQALFSYAGQSAGLIITIGIRDKNQLSLSGVEAGSNFVVNLDTHPSNSQFGNLNIVDHQSASVSEVVLGIINGLGLRLEADIAQNLIDGIWAGSKGLSDPRSGADTYEAVAICLRSGARKPEKSFPGKPVFSLAPKKPAEQPQEKPQTTTEEKTKTGTDKPPADWFEPKIFKGTSIS